MEERVLVDGPEASVVPDGWDMQRRFDPSRTRVSELAKKITLPPEVTREHLAGQLLNPAWEFIEAIEHDAMWDFHGRSRFRPKTIEIENGRVTVYRERITRRFTWAIPEPEALDFIASIAKDKGIVEIGAGSGYWAWSLFQRGIEVNAYDPHPIGHEHSWFRENDDTEALDLGRAVEFYPVEEGGIEALDLPENHDRVLFLCWPSYSNPWAYEAIQRFQGDTVVYIGEGPGGCTADGKFFHLMEGACDSWDECEHGNIPCAWEKIDAYPIPQWSGLHDELIVYKRMAKEVTGGGNQLLLES